MAGGDTLSPPQRPLAKNSTSVVRFRSPLPRCLGSTASAWMTLILLPMICLWESAGSSEVEYWSHPLANPTFADCRAACSLRSGGFLTSITSEAENALVLNTIPGGWNRAMIGGNRLSGDTTKFRWTEGPLGLEEGGLGRIFWTGADLSGSCAAGQYCKFDGTQPDNDASNEPIVGISQANGNWYDSNDGSNPHDGCACKRFKSIFFTVPLSTLGTNPQDDCDVACQLANPNSYSAWILSSDETNDIMDLFYPRIEKFYIAGGNRRGDGVNFAWSRIGRQFYTSTCVGYCNFASSQPSTVLSEDQLIVHAGTEAGQWHDVSLAQLGSVYQGCLCRNASETRSGSRSTSSSKYPSTSSTATQEVSLSQSVSSSITQSVSPSRSKEQSATGGSGSLTASVTLAASATRSFTKSITSSPSVSVTPSPTESLTFTHHVGYEKFRYWFIEISLPLRATCDIFCGADGGFPAYATSEGENMRVMQSIPPHIHSALLGGSRAFDDVNYRWVGGPLGKRHGGNGAPFFDGPDTSTGSCTLYCNFDSGLPNTTVGATEVVMYGPSSPLFGKWFNAVPSVGEGCACMNVKFHTFSENISYSESSEVSLSKSGPTGSSEPSSTATSTPWLSVSGSSSRTDESSSTISTTPATSFSSSMSASVEKTMSSSPTNDRSSSGTISPEVSVSRSGSPSSTVTLTWTASPGTSEFWYYPAPSASVSQCRSYCALRPGGFLATVTNHIEGSEVKKTLPINAIGMLGGSRLTDANNFRWTEGPLGNENGGLGRKFFSGQDFVLGSCSTYCEWNTLQPSNGIIVYAMESSGGQWNDRANGAGTGCVCMRWNTYSVALSPSSTRIISATTTLESTLSVTPTDMVSNSISISPSGEPPTISSSRSLMPTASRTLVATPSATSSRSPTQNTFSIQPSATRRSLSMSAEQSPTVTLSPPTLSNSLSSEVSATDTVTISLTRTVSPDETMTKSTTNHTEAHFSPTKTETPVHSTSDSVSLELSPSSSESNDPTPTSTLLPTRTPTASLSVSGETVSWNPTHTKHTLSPTMSISESSTFDHSKTSSQSFSASHTAERSDSSSFSLTNSRSVTPSSSAEVTHSTTRSASRTRPRNTFTRSLSLRPTRTVPKDTKSSTGSEETSITQSPSLEGSPTFTQTRPTPSLTNVGTSTESVTYGSPSSEISTSASSSYVSTASLSTSKTVSGSMERTRASDSRSVLPTVSRRSSTSNTVSDEESPSYTLSPTNDLSASLTALASATKSADATASITQSNASSASSSATREQASMTLSRSQVLSSSVSLSRDVVTGSESVSPSASPTSTASSTAEGTATQTPIPTLSATGEDTVSSTASFPSPTEDATPTRTSSPSRTLQHWSSTTSISESALKSKSVTGTLSLTNDVTRSVKSISMSLSSSRSTTVAIGTTTMDSSWSRRVSVSSTRNTRSSTVSTFPSSTQSLSGQLSASTTRSVTTALSLSSTTSPDGSETTSPSSEVSVSVHSATRPTPSATRTLIPSATLTPMPTPSTSATGSATWEPRSASWSRTPSPTMSKINSSVTTSHNKTETVQLSATTTLVTTVSRTLVSTPTPSATIDQNTSSVSTSSTLTTVTLSRHVSDTVRTPTIIVFPPLPFVVGPGNIVWWSAHGLPTIHLLPASHFSSSLPIADIVLFPTDDTGEEVKSPYRSPVAVDVADVVTNEERHIVAVSAVGFPINVTAEAAVLPARVLTSISSLPDPACVATQSSVVDRRLRVGITYNQLHMESFTQHFIVSTTLDSASIGQRDCLRMSPLSLSPTDRHFFVLDVPQSLELAQGTAGYFVAPVGSLELGPESTSVPHGIRLAMMSQPLQWVQLETTHDRTYIPFALSRARPAHQMPLFPSLGVPADITLAIHRQSSNASWTAHVVNVTLFSCPLRYSTQDAAANIIYKVATGVIEMPHTPVSAIVPDDRWACVTTSASIAVRSHGCVLRCVAGVAPTAPLGVSVRANNSFVENSPFVVRVVAWADTLLESAMQGVVRAVTILQPSGHSAVMSPLRHHNSTSDYVMLPMNWSVTAVDLEMFIASPDGVGHPVPLMDLGYRVVHVSYSVADTAVQGNSVVGTFSSVGLIERDGSVHVAFGGHINPCGDKSTATERILQISLTLSTHFNSEGSSQTLNSTVYNIRVQFLCDATICPIANSSWYDHQQFDSTRPPVTLMSGVAASAHNMLPAHRSDWETLADATTNESSASTDDADPSAALAAFTILYIGGCVMDVFPLTTACMDGDRIVVALSGWFESDITFDALPWTRSIVLVYQSRAFINGTSVVVQETSECLNTVWFMDNTSASCTLPQLPPATIASVEVRMTNLDDVVGSYITAARMNHSVHYSDLNFEGCPRNKFNATCAENGKCNVLTLACECHNDAVLGFWAGEACTVCSAGFFGPTCTFRCPGADCITCSGHGVCSDGAAGSGLCTCYNSINPGFWSMYDCSDCSPDYFGEDCKSLCTTDPQTGLVCGGHGVCDSGLFGSGSCSCSIGFTSATCTVCSSGYFGPDCTACPSGVEALPCSGHGVCADSISGNGTCSCDIGFTGTGCSVPCPVAFNTTCGWGSCLLTGTCDCEAPILLNRSSGTCSTCVSGWWGVECVNVCNCTHGLCDPVTGYCACSLGYWGPSCSNACPGGASTPCSGHGLCSPLSGVCTCFANDTHGHYAGLSCSNCDARYNAPNCDVPCPLDPVSLEPCARRGLCFNGTCTGRCIVGYWGPQCAYECPGGAANPCSGNGQCDETSGICTCTYGYSGAACQGTCPPGDAAVQPCNNHGACTDTGACSCFANNTAGHWVGWACTECADQYSGPSCTVYCNPGGGRVFGSACVCSDGYVGAGCNLACPTGGDFDSVCSGHGVCTADEAGGTAICTCSGDFYGTACNVWCTVANCASQGLFRSQCNTETGKCECLNAPRGHFGGASCNACAPGYWGAECNAPCRCNGQACDRTSATCQCSAGFGGSGHWAGEDCSVCAENYIGTDCSRLNVEVNNGSTSTIRTVNSGFPLRGIAFHDPLTDVILVGSNPVATFLTEPWTKIMRPLQVLSVASPAVSCAVFNSTHLIIALFPELPGGGLPVLLLDRFVLAHPDQSSATLASEPLAGAALSMYQQTRRERSTLANTSSTFDVVSDAEFSGCVLFALDQTNSSSITLVCPFSVAPLVVELPSARSWMGFVDLVAIVTWTEPKNISWGMTVIALPTQAAPTAVEILRVTSETVVIPQCIQYGGCSAVSHCVSPSAAEPSPGQIHRGWVWNRTAIVCGAMTALKTSNYIVFFALDTLTGKTIGANIVVPEASSISSVALDVGFRNAIFSFVGPTTAMLCRIQLSNPLELITLFSLERINGERPTVLSMALNTTTRTLWLSVATSEAVRAVAVNLFSIRIVDPKVFDQLGGVTVTVEGIGFIPNPTPLCDFHSSITADAPSTSSVPAVFVNDTTLLCVAAAVSMYDASCATLALNVWYGGRVTRTTLGRTTRPLSVTLDAAFTAESGGRPASYFAMNTLITLTGIGFVTDASKATCRIEESDGTVVAVFPATPTGATATLCKQPGGTATTHPGAILRFSHDGFVYSSSSTVFAVVGPWAGIRATLNHTLFGGGSTPPVVVADERSFVPTIVVEATDANGNVLGNLDGAIREIICSSVDPAILSDVFAMQPLFAEGSTRVMTTENGSTTFDHIYLATPKAGITTLYFFPALDRTMSVVLQLQVMPGTPSSIDFLIGTAEASWVSGVSSAFTLPAFSVVILDIVGNTVMDTAHLPTIITVRYINTFPAAERDVSGSSTTEVPVTYSATLDAKTASYAYAGLTLRSPFMVPIALRFSCSDPSINALLYTVAQETCGAGSFGVRGGYECFPCPPRSTCDGSTAITAYPGYWRGVVTSPFLYECVPPSSCRTSTECAEGYEGAMCGSCSAGYGRAISTCNRCGSPAAPWAFVGVIIVGFVVVVWALVLRTIAFSAPADVDACIVELPAKRSAISIIVKIALSHVQGLSLLPLRLLAVGFIADSLSSSGSWSVVTPGFLNVACAIGRRAINEMYATVALTGIVSIGCCLVAYLIARSDDKKFTAEARSRIAKQRARCAKDVRASPMRFRAADEAHAAALFLSPAHCSEVLRNHDQLLEEYDGDVAHVRFDPNNVEGWIGTEIDLDEDAQDFIPLHDLVAAGSPCSDTLAPLRVLRPPLWSRVVNVALVGTVVTAFLLYPTVVQAAVRVMQCRSLNMGDGTAASVVSYDPVIDCSTSEYTAVQIPAAAVLVAFGAGVPIMCPLVVLLVRKLTCSGSLDRARELFFFVTGGYRVWFWEGIVLARKAVIVVIVVLVEDDQVVCIICMWIFGGSLLLNGVMKRWESDRLGALEALSLAALSLTSLCLAAFSSSGQTMSSEIAMALVVVVAALNGSVLLTLVMELGCQASSEVIQLTGIEFSKEGEIESLRTQVAKLLGRLQRKRYVRVSNVSEFLKDMRTITLSMFVQRRESLVAGASRKQFEDYRRLILDKEKMMHLDWDPSSMSSLEDEDQECANFGDDPPDDNEVTLLQPTTFMTFMRPSTRQRSVFFEMPSSAAAGWGDPSRLCTPAAAMRTTSRDSLRTSNISVHMSGSSSEEDDDVVLQPDIVNPFAQTCFEDNPWDVIVGAGQRREFLRSREQTNLLDLGEVKELDMDATYSSVSSSVSSTLDRKRFALQSRERAAPFCRPSTSQANTSSWLLPDAVEHFPFDLPGAADDNMYDDISVGEVDCQLNDAPHVVSLWDGDIDTVSDDDVPQASRGLLAQRRRVSLYAPKPLHFDSEKCGKRSVTLSMENLLSQYRGTARALAAVFADLHNASARMAITQVLSLNKRIDRLLNELFMAEFTFLHHVWAYERGVRSGLWDSTKELEESEEVGSQFADSVAKHEVSNSIDLEDFDIDSTLLDALSSD